MDRSKLDAAILSIRAYTSQHAELRQSHHFLFDLPLDKAAGKPEFVIMGVNPGEREHDIRSANYTGAEETWLSDFHARSGQRSRGSINWRNNASFFANGRPVVFTELFFWSSRNGSALVERYGPLWESPHMAFCCRLNRLLLKEYMPEAVLFAGLSHADRVAAEFDLQHVGTLRDAGKRDRLIEHYCDQERPWFFTKHWSASYGFSKVQKINTRNYIHEHLHSGVALGQANTKLTSVSVAAVTNYSATDIIRLRVDANPKTGKSRLRFDCYRDGMTVAEYENMVRIRLGAAEATKCGPDLKWDTDPKRHFISIERG